ncbi:DUF6338 family protein [Nocardioides sp. LML1-1-1.1]|uniref:DUF6338 family protein n=1 Tax=Nocardioides sp. LML1-1-1.1 TaxID=3135248 RepID=UPI00342A11EE
MPTSVQAAAAVVICLMPGALYIWSFERQVGRWGVGLSDRLLRFVGASAVFHALAAPASYVLWREYWPVMRVAGALPWWLWLVSGAYVVLPLSVGTAIGRGSRHGSPWARYFTGPDPAPRAWDYLFQGGRDGWIRLRLKSGSWIGGAFATTESGLKSYTAGYPEPQDIFLATAVDVDPESGAFLFEANGSPRLRSGGVLVRWEEVEYLEFIDA